MLSNIWVWDPGSGINLFRIPDLGVKKAPDPESGSATLQYFVTLFEFLSLKNDVNVASKSHKQKKLC